MGWFKKKGVDVVDLGEMQRKGYLRGDSGEVDEEGIVDLGVSPVASSSESSSPPTPSGGSMFGMLDSLAGAGNSSSESSSGGESGVTSFGSSGGYSDKLKVARGSRLAEFNSMKVKMEDIEYKVDKMIERLEALEARLMGSGG